MILSLLVIIFIYVVSTVVVLTAK